MKTTLLLIRPITTVLVSILFIGCAADLSTSNREFVNKYGELSFMEFENTAIHIRGKGAKNDKIIFISDLKNSCRSPFVVNVDISTGQIIETSKKLLADTCVIDEQRLKDLVLLFDTFHIAGLMVDSNHNVSIKVFSTERELLKRFADPKNLPERYENWVHISGNWYENPEGN